jgi:hypothetical protein
MVRAFVLWKVSSYKFLDERPCLKIRRSLKRGGSRGCRMGRMKQRSTRPESVVTTSKCTYT